MATLSHVQSRRLYSWWWDSHVSPKNSKWLQENLTDMDVKVKSMIKLIEEDADSFRKRAEMYYRKRPELMKLVEEFYRAYRALAERYDHATGALRHAHRTMTEAFPDQIPLMLPDESPSGSSANDGEPHTPSFLRDLISFDSNGSPEENEEIMFKARPRRLNEMSKYGEEVTSEKFGNGRARKGLNFENLAAKDSGDEESRRASIAEIDNLKSTVSKLEFEKEAVALQNQLSQAKVSSLESDISRMQEDVKKLNSEMVLGLTKLKSAEDQCYLLEQMNHSLQSELDSCKERAKERLEELKMKQEELEKCNISINNEHQKYVQADLAHQSLEELHSQSVEEVRQLTLEIEKWAEKLRYAETSKVCLEEEIRKLKEEISSLTEQNRSYCLKIIHLQDEINLLEESKRKLEDEVMMLVGENKALQVEVSSIKEGRNDLEQRHHALTEQMEATHLNVESLQALVKELQDGNIELKELCNKHEDERILHVENLKHTERITEKNVVLENSLSKANAELEELREKVATLEKSCEVLEEKISVHVSEKAVLVTQMEAIVRNMEKLSENNTLLENSLSDVNVELEGLRGMLNVSEQSCESLHAQISSLLAEKSGLVNKVQSIGLCLENLETKYKELEGKNLNLQNEKDCALDQVTQLQHSLQLEKEEYETLMQSTRSQMAILSNQISALQENGKLREKELELEHDKIIDAQIEIFILQRCLYDMRERNIVLSDKCREYSKTSRSQEELISKLEQEISMQKRRLSLLSEYNNKLVDGVYQVMRTLNISKDHQPTDDLHFNLILVEIGDLKTSILDAQDDIHQLILEKSVILSLLKQFAVDTAEVKSEKDLIEQESETRFQEVLVSQSERHKLLELNEELREYVQACNQKEEVLKGEMVIVCQQLSDSQEARSTLQSDISKLLHRNELFSEKIHELRGENDTLEEENRALLAEAMKLEHLYCVFKSYNAESALDLQLLNNNMDHVCKINGGLGRDIISMNEKLVAAEVENLNLKESLVNLQECRRQLVILEDEVETTRNTCEQLNAQIELEKNLLVQNEMELLAANNKVRDVEDRNMELSEHMQSLEQKNLTLLEHNTLKDNEIAVLLEANDALNRQLDKLSGEVEELKDREKHLTSELQNRTEQVRSCEVEIETLLNDIQIATIDSAIFEEKMFELLIKCESLEVCAVIQKEISQEKISERNMMEDNIKEKLDAVNGENKNLKEELSAYLPLVLSVRDCVTTLEGHMFSLAKYHSQSNQELQDNSLSVQKKNCSEEGTRDHCAVATVGIFELQKLQAKVSALEKVVLEIQDHLEQDRFIHDTSIQSAKLEGEGQKSGESKAEISEDKTEQVMKDIQLDHVLSSSHYENGSSSCAPSLTGSDEIRDQMMDIWETVDSNKLEKLSPVSSDHGLEYHQVEAVEEEKSEFSVTEKELSINPEPTKIITELNQEKIKSISERLSSDAERLSLLQKSAKELEKNMENSELNNSPTNSEFKKVRAQLKEAEGAILQLIDTNKKLTKKAEKISLSSESLVSGQVDEIENTSERKLFDRGSEKIGRLELELHKLEFLWLKLKEEHDYRMARAAERRTRVLLSDYMYGRREIPKRKKVFSCACIRSKTTDD